MYVHSLHLENIKAFESLELEFSRSGTSAAEQYAGINVFAGGNSSGKSTLLKCIAMAVSGPTVANQQVISSAGWVRREAARGQIEAKLRFDAQRDGFKGTGAAPSTVFPVGLVLEPTENNAGTLKEKRYVTPRRSKVISAERGPWNVESLGWFLGGYGPLRRLTGSSTDALRYALGKGKLASCVTLFREDAALSESETWIKQEHARALEQRTQQRTPSRLTEDVQAFLNDGLLPEGFTITRITVDHVYMQTPNGGELPLRDLSDGCRSAYALMLDIIHNMSVAYGTERIFSQDNEGRIIVNFPGVVLIDEIEAHLHPTWQQKICSWLRSRFPFVQFFVTSHSPLIVQSADAGGIFVLPLPHEMSAGREVRRLDEDEQKKIMFGRAEKVLLGEAFGLRRTWSSRAEAHLKRWEKLTALRETNRGLTDGEMQEYKELKEQMSLLLDGTEAPTDA
jgi:predicted ATPase